MVQTEHNQALEHATLMSDMAAQGQLAPEQDLHQPSSHSPCNPPAPARQMAGLSGAGGSGRGAQAAPSLGHKSAAGNGPSESLTPHCLPCCCRRGWAPPVAPLPELSTPLGPTTQAPEMHQGVLRASAPLGGAPAARTAGGCPLGTCTGSPRFHAATP